MGKTIAIIDHAHCGTTLLASLLQAAGVPMVGNNYKEEKWEDLDIIATLKPDGDKAFGWLVRKRNEQHDVWGFKYAGAWRFMDLMLKHLRNPIFLAIYKDPVSVTYQRFGTKEALMGKVLNTIQQFHEGITGITATGQPVHMLSYHKAVITPALFIEEVLNIVDVDADIDNLIGFIRPNDGGPRKRYPSVKKWTMVQYEESDS